MDDIVQQALAKWPNVPHCYGWLALDARGAFRMRDEAAQAAGHAGEVIRHSALLSFIHRNYLHDERGAWYFQNGPQRVYVELAATPFIARSDPAQGFVLHDGRALGKLTAAWMTEDGRLVLQDASQVAMLDDRDLAGVLPGLRLDGALVEDTALLAWLAAPEARLELALGATSGNKRIPVQPIASSALGARLGFIAHPQRLAR